MKYRLELALGDDLSKDIKSFEFEDLGELIQKISSFGLEDERVFLCAIEDKDGETEILISENWRVLQNFIDNITDVIMSYGLTIYFQQYESYEDAYAVALDMKEPNPLCYSKDSNLLQIKYKDN